MDILTIVGWTVGSIGILAAGFERYRNVKLNALRETSTVWREDRDAWKARYETEHGEYKDYREKAHTTAGETQAKIFSLTEENQRLHIKTDITPLIEDRKEQQIINQRILQSLDLIVQRLSHHEP